MFIINENILNLTSRCVLGKVAPGEGFEPSRPLLVTGSLFNSRPRLVYDLPPPKLEHPGLACNRILGANKPSFVIYSYVLIDFSLARHPFGYVLGFMIIRFMLKAMPLLDSAISCDDINASARATISPFNV